MRRYVARVDLETWPLSAAATQVLIDLRPDRAPLTSPQKVSRLAMKELVLRGALQITSIKPRKVRKTSLRISTGHLTGSATLPAPLGMLLRALPEADDTELSDVIRRAAKRDPKLFSTKLKDAAIAELVRLGLAEEQVLRVARFFRRTVVVPTKSGVLAAETANAAVKRAIALEVLAVRDVSAAAREADELGIFVLLGPSGLSVAGKIARRRRGLSKGDGGDVNFDSAFDDSTGGHHGSHGTVITDHAGAAATNVSIIALIDQAFGDVIDSVDGAFASFDAAFDSVDSSFDAGISDGGGDGGGGGGDGGGGGCGGGCGGGS